MNPTGLPQLSNPLRDLNFDQKREKLKFQSFEKFQNYKKSSRLFAVQRTTTATRFDLKAIMYHKCGPPAAGLRLVAETYGRRTNDFPLKEFKQDKKG